MTERNVDESDDGSPAHADASRPVAERVESLLDRMTVAEKVGQTVGTFVGRLDRVGSNSVGDVENLVRERNVGSVAAFGIGVSQHRDPREVAEVANRVQRVAVEETRLGVPLLLPVDAVHGHAFVDGATVFPHGQGMAAARDPGLVERAAAVTARELRATGANHNYAPTADVTREPRWGRTFETYAESPHLVAELVDAEVRGYQRPDAAGDDGAPGSADTDAGAGAGAALSPEGVAATVKHFPAYSDPVRGEDAAPVQTSETRLRRTFLPPFEAAVDAGAVAVMPCYNAVDAEPAHGSARYLRDLLRDDVGFEGVVASDWNGVRMLESGHRVVDSYEDAVELAREAGVDVASVGDAVHLDALGSLVESDDLSESLLDESVRRILEVKFRLGLFENPYADPDVSVETLGRDAHRELAREAARRSMTLLRNEGDVLPFSPDADVLVTGPNADSLDHQLGGWTGPQNDGVTVREGVERVVGADAVAHVPGSGIREPGDVDAAAAAAGDADAAVVVLGEPDYFHEFARYEGESGFETGEFPTRTDLTLPDAQRELLREVVATETPTALVLVSGRPLAIPWAAENVPAILSAYYPGAEGGVAVAETLFGENDPAGLLPASVPRSTGHLPTLFDHLNHPRPTREPEHPPSYDPLFPFGHGRHYADFEVESVEASAATVPADGSVDVEVTVANVGDRAGTFAADAFLTDRVSSRVAPVRERRGTVRTAPAPGERTTAAVTVPASSLGVVGPDGRREAEPGEFEVRVAGEAAQFEVR